MGRRRRRRNKVQKPQKAAPSVSTRLKQIPLFVYVLIAIAILLAGSGYLFEIYRPTQDIVYRDYNTTTKQDGFILSSGKFLPDLDTPRPPP